jgi:hypothetical protein
MDKTLQTLESLEEIIDEVICGEMNFIIKMHNDAPYLQIFFDAPDVDTGEIEEQACRKWVLQLTMSNTEVVRTAYKAAEAVMIHELQEHFRYRGARVYDPHLDVEQLVKFLDREGLQDIRVGITKVMEAS